MYRNQRKILSKFVLRIFCGIHVIFANFWPFQKTWQFSHFFQKYVFFQILRVFCCLLILLLCCCSGDAPGCWLMSCGAAAAADGCWVLLAAAVVMEQLVVIRTTTARNTWKSCVNTKFSKSGGFFGIFKMSKFYLNFHENIKIRPRSHQFLIKLPFTPLSILFLLFFH